MKKNFKYFMFCVAALFAFHSSSILADGHAGEAKPEMMKLEPMTCLLYTSPSPRDGLLSRMPSSA